MKIGDPYYYHGIEVLVMAITEASATFGYFKNSIGFERKFGDNDFPIPARTVNNCPKKQVVKLTGNELNYN